jgi:hypothetical protein
MSYTFNPNNSFNTSSGIGYKFGGASTTGTTTTASSGSKVGNFFRSSTGQAAISQGIGSLLSFGLSAFSSNQARQDLKGQANIVAQQSQTQLQLSQDETERQRIAYETAKLQGAGAGGNTALYIGLGVVGVVVLGVVIFAVTRRSA